MDLDGNIYIHNKIQSNPIMRKEGKTEIWQLINLPTLSWKLSLLNWIIFEDESVFHISLVMVHIIIDEAAYFLSSEPPPPAVLIFANRHIYTSYFLYCLFISRAD